MFEHHAWEDGADDEDAAELVAAPSGDEEGDTSDSEAEPVGPSAYQEFLAEMEQLLLSRTISARDFCVLAYWVSKAGISTCQPFGKAPGAQSGDYQRHLEKALEIFKHKDLLYELEVPCVSNELGRATHLLHAVPPHEVVDEAVENDPTIALKTLEAVEANELPPAYFQHPVVRAELSDASAPMAFAVYMDGVQYSQVDTVIGFWLVNLVTGARHLSIVLRKKLLCDCGCRGWCTLHTIFVFLRWSIGSLAIATYPGARHDASPFLVNTFDASRASKAGKRLAERGVVVYLKCDWAEYSGTVGFPAHIDGLRPCFGCNAFGDGLYETEGLSEVWEPWRNNEPGDYDRACQACEIVVRVTAVQHRELTALLVYDRRQRGSRGLALLQDYPALRLRRGDRVEPTRMLPNVDGFEKLTQFPQEVLFWRPSLETLARHRCPLFCDDTGLEPATCMTIDLLHAMYLGCMNKFCELVVWLLLCSGFWGTHGNEEEQVAISIQCMKHELLHFYAAYRQRRPRPKPLTELRNLTKKMVGERAAPKLKVKGAQCWVLLLFLNDFLTKHENMLAFDAGRWAAAGVALERFCKLLDELPVNPTATQRAQSLDLWKRHMALTSEAEDLFIPKRHLICHMILSMPLLGNPRFYAYWFDESLNKVLKLACRGISQATFETSCLLRMPSLLQRVSSRTKGSAA